MTTQNARDWLLIVYGLLAVWGVVCLCIVLIPIVNGTVELKSPEGKPSGQIGAASADLAPSWPVKLSKPITILEYRQLAAQSAAQTDSALKFIERQLDSADADRRSRLINSIRQITERYVTLSEKK